MFCFHFLTRCMLLAWPLEVVTAVARPSRDKAPFCVTSMTLLKALLISLVHAYDVEKVIKIVLLLILQPLKEASGDLWDFSAPWRPWKLLHYSAIINVLQTSTAKPRRRREEGMKGLYIAVISARSRFCLCNIIYHQFMNFYCHANEGTNQDYQASLPTKKQIS